MRIKIKATTFITTSLLSLPSDAVHRYFESCRREWNDSQLSRRERAKKKSSLRAKQLVLGLPVYCLYYSSVVRYTSSFAQLYHWRAKYAKGKEKDLWDQIDAGFMSDESTHESDDGPFVHTHTPSYRSDSECVSVTLHSKKRGIILHM